MSSEETRSGLALEEKMCWSGGGGGGGRRRSWSEEETPHGESGKSRDTMLRLGSL
jgi:hypothetical protein